MPSFCASLATFVRSSHVQPSANGELSPKSLTDASPSHGSRTTAQAVANQLGLDRVEVEILPQQKSEVVKKLQDEGARSRWPETASTTPGLGASPRGHRDGHGRGHSDRGSTLVRGGRHPFADGGFDLPLRLRKHLEHAGIVAPGACAAIPGTSRQSRDQRLPTAPRLVVTITGPGFPATAAFGCPPRYNKGAAECMRKHALQIG